MTAPVLEARALVKEFPVGKDLLGRPRELVHAVNGVSFVVERGRTLAIVGESGCGKSTVGRVLLGLTPPTAGVVVLNGRRVDNIREAERRVVRSQLQVVFQDPFSSLNPRMRIGVILAEPLVNFRQARSAAEARAKAEALLRKVSLPVEALDRFPHEFSGGQRQRIGIARALAGRPDIIICDEAVSALDVSIQAQIVNLLMDLQEELGLSLLFISHDLSVVEHMAHDVAVMYLGKIVEHASRSDLFRAPRHPYTRALLDAAPVPKIVEKPERKPLSGDVPSPVRLPSGCAFYGRCPKARDICRRTEPPLAGEADGHRVACHFPLHQ
jgi:peptide/nickel transport system ATP-binding protein